MKRSIKLAFIILVLCSFAQSTATDPGCGMKNVAFQAGEQVTMKVFYSAMGVYIGAGEATFTTTLEKFNGKDVYHCVGEGKTYSFFDDFYKVRDRYESYIDTS